MELAVKERVHVDPRISIHSKRLLQTPKDQNLTDSLTPNFKRTAIQTWLSTARMVKLL